MSCGPSHGADVRGHRCVCLSGWGSLEGRYAVDESESIMTGKTNCEFVLAPRHSLEHHNTHIGLIHRVALNPFAPPQTRRRAFTATSVARTSRREVRAWSRTSLHTVRYSGGKIPSGDLPCQLHFAATKSSSTHSRLDSTYGIRYGTEPRALGRWGKQSHTDRAYRGEQSQATSR